MGSRTKKVNQRKNLNYLHLFSLNDTLLCHDTKYKKKHFLHSNKCRSMIPRYVGKKKSASTATTPTFTSAIAEECKKISMAYMDQAASKPEPSDDILDLGDEETNALIDKIMQGTEGSGDIIDLDMLLSGAAETQSEPSATPARYSFDCSSLTICLCFFGHSLLFVDQLYSLDIFYCMM